MCPTDPTLLFPPLAQKTEPRSPPSSPGAPPPACPRPLQAPHDRAGEENVFSHLPLHSQHLARTPYPMIPIGGIQMVQARPSSHASLVPGPVLSLQAGHFVPSASRVTRRDGEPQSPPEPSSESVSPVAKVSKFTLSPEQPAAGGFAEEKMRTSEFHPEQEELSPADEAEPSQAHQPQPSVSPGSPNDTPQEPCPEPPASGEEPSKATGKQQSGSSSTSSEPACTFISARDSPSEAPPGHPQAQPCSPSPRNLSGSSPHPEHSDLGQTHEKVDENAGST